MKNKLSIIIISAVIIMITFTGCKSDVDTQKEDQSNSAKGLVYINSKCQS